MLDESLLTGESVPAERRPVKIHRASFAGTLVVRGAAKALVTATGARSEMGRIGKDLHSIETEQPHLQRQMKWLIRDFAIAGALAGAGVVVLFGLFRGSWLQALLGGIAWGCRCCRKNFLVMTVFMAMGARRISQARVLTRRASAIETLGATTVLCTDKTGTLTENRMTVVTVKGTTHSWEVGEKAEPAEEIREILDVARSASAMEPVDPMDVAVHVIAKAFGLPLATDRSLVRAYGLRPDLLAVTHVIAESASQSSRAFAKGAVEAIAELCHLGTGPARGSPGPGGTTGEPGIRVPRSPDRRGRSTRRPRRCRTRLEASTSTTSA